MGETMALRSERIPVRVTPAEKAFLTAAAAKHELTLSEYLRQAGERAAQEALPGTSVGVPRRRTPRPAKPSDAGLVPPAPIFG